MNCRQVVNLMSAYVDGELTGEDMLVIRRHLSTCPECAEEHESILATKRAVANLATAPPREHLVAAILSRLDEVAVPRHQRFADWLIRVLQEKVSPVAAALAVSGAALVILSAGEVDRLAPVTTADMGSTPAQQVSFLRGLDSDPGVLASAQPLKLATDIPGMGEARGHFVSLTAQ